MLELPVVWSTLLRYLGECPGSGYTLLSLPSSTAMEVEQGPLTSQPAACMHSQLGLQFAWIERPQGGWITAEQGKGSRPSCSPPHNNRPARQVEQGFTASGNRCLIGGPVAIQAIAVVHAVEQKRWPQFVPMRSFLEARRFASQGGLRPPCF